MIRVFRIIFILFVLALGTLTFFSPAKVETNILRAIFPENQQSEMIINLSNKFSSKINVLIESETIEKTEEISKDFLSKVDKEFFKIKDIDFIKSYKEYEKYNANFLSKNTRKLLLDKDYETVKAQAFERLINPIGISMLPLEQDPFLLFTDYLMSFASDNTSQAGSTINYNDKYYKVVILGLDSQKALSPTLVNEKIKELIKTSEDYEKVYLTGVPIHSYYASSKSIVEINAICVLSTLFLVLLFYFYFRNLKLALPALSSLALGMSCGYCAVSLLFSQVHILTFVFSTTLIGVCIDYSLHYFVEKDLKKIFKSLTVSLLSTSCAFLVLTFSGLELLKQISLYTVVGLVSVYTYIVLFYPIICKNIFKDFSKNIEIRIKHKPIVLSVIFLVILAGALKLNFNDDIKNMYVPSKKLLVAEKLFAQVTNANFKTSFVIVEGEDIEDIFQKEEIIAENIESYQSISKFIPSKKRQAENQQLRSELYEKELSDYANFLTKEQINSLKKKDVNGFIEYDKSSMLSELMLGQNKSLMILYDVENPNFTLPDGAKYVDLQKNISSKISEYRVKCLTLILPILFALILVLSLIYKNPIKSVRIVFPSMIGAAFALAFVSLFFKEINMFHILSVFLIIGFGLDYSVFRASGVKNSKGAVVLSCATSVFSFLLLSFTSFKLISSLGVILSVGLLTSYILSLVLIPSSGLEENKESI